MGRNPVSMTSLRPQRLTRVLVCLSGLLVAGSTVLAQQSTPPAGNRNNPFENIPQTTPGTTTPRPAAPTTTAPAPAAPANAAVQTPQFETPTPAQPAPAAAGETLASDVIEAIEFRGSRRVPQDTLRALIFSRKGDVYN